MSVSSITSPVMVLDQQKLKTWASERTAHVIAHEQSHLAGLGPVGGTMHLDYAEVGGVRFAAGGHVSFKMPQVDATSMEAVQKSKMLFGHVLAGAKAVGDPSVADSGIADSAAQALGQINIAEHAWSNIHKQALAMGLPPQQVKGLRLNIAA